MERLTLAEAYSTGAHEGLRLLVGRIRISLAGFAFYPVACSLPEPLSANLSQECQHKGIGLIRLDLSSQLVQDLRQRVLELTPAPLPARTAIMITGLEPSILLDGNERRPAILQIMNMAREGFQASLPCPLILCLAASCLGKVQEVAPDFWAWRKAAALKFRPTPGYFRQELQQALVPAGNGGWEEAVARVGWLARLQETYESLQAGGEIGAELRVELELAAELGDAYRSLRKYGKARVWYEKALGLAREAEDQQKLPQILNNLGIVLRGLRDPEGSLKFFQDYLELAAGQGDSHGQVAALNNIGLIHLDAGRLAEAETALRQALERSREWRDLPALRSTMVNLGVVLRQQGKIDEAITLYYEALAFSPGTPSEGPYPWQQDLLSLGDAYAAKGWSSAAAACYEAARRISRAARDLLREKDALKKLGEWASRPVQEPEAEELAELERLDVELNASMGSLEEQAAWREEDTHVEIKI